MTMKESGIRTGDLLVSEGAAPIVTRESKVVTNGGGTSMVLSVGYPMDDNVPVIAANIANTDGLLLENITIEAGKTAKVAVLARGPAAINATVLPTKDYAAANINAANFITAIKALGIVVRSESPTQTTTWAE